MYYFSNAIWNSYAPHCCISINLCINQFLPFYLLFFLFFCNIISHRCSFVKFKRVVSRRPVKEDTSTKGALCDRVITVFTNQSHAASGASSFREQLNKSDTTNIWHYTRSHRDICVCQPIIEYASPYIATVSLIQEFHIYFALRHRFARTLARLHSMKSGPLRQLLRLLIQDGAEIVGNILSTCQVYE